MLRYSDIEFVHMSVEISYIVMFFSLMKKHIQASKPFKSDLLVEYEKPQNDLCPHVFSPERSNFQDT